MKLLARLAAMPRGSPELLAFVRDTVNMSRMVRRELVTAT